MTSYTTLKTSRLGNLILAANATHLIGLYFADCEHVPADYPLPCLPRRSPRRRGERAEGKGVAGHPLLGERARGEGEHHWKLDPKHAVLRQAREEISEYLAGGRKTFSVPIHYAGTDFQNEIWRQIALIPFGETITYTDLAQRAGTPSALRAAGTATGRNRIGIIIPCHRVVGKNGGLGGYAGGLERKIRLLLIESNTAACATNGSR